VLRRQQEGFGGECGGGSGGVGRGHMRDGVLFVF